MPTIRTFLLTLLLSLTATAHAQRIEMISGQVRAADGAPIEGVTVTEVDSNSRTVGSAVTDAGGMFNLAIRNSAQNSLLFQADGYEPLRAPINRSTVRVFLQSAKAVRLPEPGVPIDLGLNVKWADRNVGALTPAHPGTFYSWGEITEKDYYAATDHTNFGDDIDDTEYDPAHVYWKSRWSMPTRADIAELVERCAWVWTSLDSVPGYKVIGPNGNSIFLPAAGMRFQSDTVGAGEQGNYWSGSYFENKPESAYALEFNRTANRLYHGHRLRIYGMLIRPVWK